MSRATSSFLRNAQSACRWLSQTAEKDSFWQVLHPLKVTTNFGNAAARSAGAAARGYRQVLQQLADFIDRLAKAKPLGFDQLEPRMMFSTVVAAGTYLTAPDRVDEGQVFYVEVNNEAGSLEAYQLSFGDGTTEVVDGSVTEVSHQYSDGPAEYPVSVKVAHGTEGLSHGYWRGSQHVDDWTGYEPSDSFEEIFGVDVPASASAGTNPTLIQALRGTGGGVNALLREAVAGLLNASHPNIDYRFFATQVISKVQGAFLTGQYEMVKNDLEAENKGQADLGPANSPTATLWIAVDNLPPGLTPAADQTADEGTVVTLDLGSLSDAGVIDYPWTVTLDLGDGSGATSFTVMSQGDLPTVSHMFADNGQYTATVTAEDKDGATTSSSFNVVVANAAPVLAIAADQTANEGALTSFALGSISDLGLNDGPWSVSVDPGDGSPAIEFSANEQGELPLQQHRYLDDGQYTVSVTVTDKDMASATGSFAVNVSNLPPEVTSLAVEDGVEGQEVILAVAFTDDGILDGHTGLVVWTDGSTTPLVIDPATRTATASHLYLNDGVYYPSVQITDNAGDSATASTQTTIANAPPVITGLTIANGIEGDIFVLTGSYSDLGLLDGHTAWAAWGDSTTSLLTVDPLTRTFTGSHVYVDEGTYTPVITVVDDGGASAEASTELQVENAAPIVLSVNLTAAQEGQTTVLIAPFSDAGANDEHTGLVYWNDGTPPTVATIDPVTRVLTAQHTYLDNGNYSPLVVVTDNAGAGGELAGAVQITNAPPVLSGATDQNGSEGTAASLNLGSIADAGVNDAPWSVVINPGDGSPTIEFTVAEQGQLPTLDHVFLDDGTYQVTVQLTDKDGATAEQGFNVVVANAAPVITALEVADGEEGLATSLTAAYSDFGVLDTHLAVILWGDGSESIGLIDPVSRTITAEHVYVQDGNYTVTLTLTDNGGASATLDTVAYVANAAPVLTPAADQTAVEGTSVSLLLGSFADLGSQDGPWTVAIDPGDGSSVVEFTIAQQGELPSFDYTYLDNGDFLVSVSVTDGDGATASGSFAVAVANAAPVLTPAADQAATEGTPVGLLLGSFGDLGTQDGPWAVAIDPGDGSSVVEFTIAQQGELPSFDYTYLDNGDFLVSVSVTDGDGATTSGSFAVAVANAAPVLTMPGDQTATEGTVTSINLGSIADLGSLDGPWAVAVDLGDGTLPVEISVDQLGALPALEHTFLNDGSYQVVVSVTDSDGASTSGSFAMVVANAAPVLNLSNDQAATEGSGATIELGSFGDLGSQDGPWTVAVDPGDGSSSLEFTVDEQGTLPNLSHTFADNGIYPVIVTITDNGGASTSGSFNVVTANVPPSLTISGDDEGIVGQAYTLNLSSVDPGADTIEYWAINWDLLNTAPGSEPEVIPGDPSSVQHTYAQAGTYTIRATATDEDGSFDSNSISVEMTVVVVGTLLVENSDFTVSHEQLFTVPENPGSVSFQFMGLSFDQTSGAGGGGDSMKDAFEVALVSPTTGLPLVGTITAGRDAFFNLTESQLPGLGGGARYDANTNTVMLDITGLAPGSTAKLIYRLVNNDDDTTTAVTILPDLDLSGSAILGATTATPSTVRALPGAVDFSLLSEVTASMDVDYTRTSWNQQRDLLYANLTLTNAGTYEVRNSGGSKLLLGVANISSPQVVAYQPDGLTPEGMPYFDISHLAFSETDGTLAPGESVSGIELRFANPTGVQFSYDLVILGHVNEAPAFASTPVIEVPVGKPYSYAAQASDPDGDVPSFTLLSGPAGMIVDAQTGQVIWNTTGDDLGNHSILLEVADGRGGVTRQAYNLSVVNVPNRPPIFTSTPLTDGNAFSEYRYQATASDPDQDDLAFALVSGPEGLTVDADGLITWTPTAAQLGLHDLSISVADPSGAQATQGYSVLVQQAVGNNPPVIVSQPVVSFVLPALPNEASGTVEPTSLDLSLDLGGVQTSEVQITLSGGDGGAFGVPNPGPDNNPPTNNTISGQVFYDANENGTKETDELVLPGWTIYIDANGNQIRDWGEVATETDSGGNYRFTDLTPGTYTIAMQLQSGWIQTAPPDSVGWQRLSDAADPRSIAGNISVAAGALIGNRLYVSHGFRSFYSTDLSIYDIPTDTWINGGAEAPNAYYPRLELAGAAVNGNFYAIGGRSGESFVPYVEEYAPTTLQWTTKEPMIVPKASFGTAVWDGLIYAVGGAEASGSFDLPPMDSSDIEAYDPVTDTWTQLAPMPIARSWTSATVAFDGKIYVFGGAVNYFESTSTVQIYDIATNSWSLGASMPTPRYAAAAGGIGDKIIVAGGLFGEELATTEVYDPATDAWTTGPTLLVATSGMATGNMSDGSRMFVVGSGFVGTMGLVAPGVTQELSSVGRVHVVNLGSTEVNGLDFGNARSAATVAVDLIASGSNEPFANLSGVRSDIATGDSASFNIQFTGDGQAHSFDLLFINSATAEVLGSIPVKMNYDYSDQARAVDPDGDPLTYSLALAPEDASIDPTNGVVTWEPQSPGDYEFRIRVEDGRGGSDEQSFTLRVSVSNEGNTDPIIASTPPASTRLGRVFSYQAQASDPDGDGLAFYLANAPEGMSIDRRTGQVRWTPQSGQLGEQAVTVRVLDGRGGSDEQTFTLTVNSASYGNEFPVITSTPEIGVALGETYRYDMAATDADADQLTFKLLVGPEGMGVDVQTGQVVWSPDPDQLGVNTVLLSVSDGQGGVDIQSFSVEVRQSNRAPTISSAPQNWAFSGIAYAYQAHAQDLDGDVVIFSLADAPTGMGIDPATGMVTWTPTVLDIGTTVVTVVASDGFGGAATQQYELGVSLPGANRSPLITSNAREAIGIGKQLFYVVSADDPDGDVLTASLVDGPAGMTFDAVQKLVRWTPTAAQLGFNSFTVRVEDGRDGSDERTFTVEVSNDHSNSEPSFVSQPSVSSVVNRQYIYDAAATDLDNDPVIFTLGDAPDGMAIDFETGVIIWTPRSDQLGDHLVRVVVVDTFGSASVQDYTLTVRGANSAPLITSTPKTTASAGTTYGYQLTATDVDQDTLSFALLSGPAGMSIDSETGLVVWTPQGGQLGSHSISVRATDGFAGVATQQYTMEVAATPQNLPPTISSQPRLAAVVNEPYSYQVVAVDPDAQLGATLHYELLTGDPGITLDPDTGLLQWTPTTLVTQPIALAVIDSSGAASFQSSDLLVRDNSSPIITSMPRDTVTAGLQYSYDLRVNDADGDPLVYELLAGPNEMTVDQSGRIRWQTGLVDIPENTPVTYLVHVRATDSMGESAEQQFDVTVGPDEEPPSVAILTNSGWSPGVVEWPRVLAVDNREVVSRTLTINGQALRLDGTGRAEITVDYPGEVILTATATDAAGNVGSTSMVVPVFDPFGQGPTVEVTSPNLDVAVTAPVDVIGTVSDDQLGEYVLTYASTDNESTGTFVEFARGTTSVSNGVLGQFDPTLLANGSYVLRLEARDWGGNTSVTDQVITVTGALKLGNFNLSFTDLSLPLGGIPITISRTYDTLNANRMGDFGYGWDLDIVDVRLTTDLAGSETTGMEDLGVLPAFRDGTRVYVTLPDGTRQGFTFVPKPLDPPPGTGSGGQFGAALLANVLGLFQPAFIPDRGVTSTLTVGTGLQILRQDDGTYIIPGGNIPFNPASDLLSSTYSTYTLTLRDGVQYQVDGHTGHMLPIKDRNGNTMEIRDDGIFTRTPQGNLIAQVPFERDQLGRITKITDPEGNSIRYAYDANGDLVSVTDRLDATTALQYAITDNPHVLGKITNALGQDAMALQYDPDTGRITSLGVPGAAIPFSYRLDLGDGRFAEQVADAKGVPSILVKDVQGNLIRRIQRLTDNADSALRKFLVTVWQYDANNNQTHESDTFQVTSEASSYDAAPPYWRSIKTFDAAGNVTSETNALGQTSYFTYDSQSNLLTSTGFDGNTTSNQYDDRGNLIRMVDAAGIATTYEYDANGNQIGVRNSFGVVVSSSTYDASGRLTSSTPAAGLTTFYAYDSNGNQTRSWQVVTTDEGTFQIIDQTTYDAQGNMTGAARIVNDGSGERTLSSNSTHYNDLGQQVEAINELGYATRYVFDYRGQLIETRQESRNPDGSTAWLLSRTVYDDNGRTIFSTDTFLEGQSPARGYVTLTDDQGRSVGSQTFKDPEVDLVEEVDGLHAVLTSSGMLISATSSVLDERGRVAVSTDRFGTETRYLYDLTGRNVQTRRQARDETGQVVWVVSEQVYNALSRVLVSTAEHVEGQPSTSTHAVYDSLGRQMRNEHLWGVVVQVTIDPETGLASSSLTDPGQVVAATESRYNSLGQISETTDSRGGITTFEYDDLGRNVATIGPAVNVVGYADPIRQRMETIYDEQGRASQTLSRIVVLADGTQDRSQLIATSMVYDELGRVVQINLPDGTNTRTEYDDLGRKVAETDQAGRTKRYEYAAATEPGAGSLAAVIQPELDETALAGTPNTTGSPRYEYDYDARGNLVVIRDALGRETTFTYDNQNRQLSRTLPLGQVESIEYDDLGRESLHTSFEGVVTHFTYDNQPGSSGRLASKEFYPNRQAYDDVLASLPGAGPDEVWTYSYTALGQMAEVVQDRDGNLATTEDARPEARDYDLDGRLSVVATPEGIINYTYDLATGDHTGTWTGTDPAEPFTDIVYGYDTLGRLVLVSNTARFGEFLAQPDNMTYAYDLTGQLAQQVFPNGITSDYTRDVLGRTVELTQTRPDGVLVASYSYILDVDGRRLGVVETELADQDLLTYETRAIRWTYDDGGRLSREEHDFDITAPETYDWSTAFEVDRRVDYVLDLLGNRLWQLSDFNGDGMTDEQIGYTYDANDRLLVEAGRIVEGVVTTAEYFWGADIIMGGATGDATYQTAVLRYEQNAPAHVLEQTEYVYNLQGQLAEAHIQREEGGHQVATDAAYEYNQEGIRYQKVETTSVDGGPATTTTTEYLVDPNNPTGYQQTLEERTTTTQADGSTETTETVNIAGPAVSFQADSEGNLHILLADALGSTRQVADQAARIVQSLMYDAFGVNLRVQAVSNSRITVYQYRNQYREQALRMDYLRARWMIPAIQRFVSQDPAEGEAANPTSMHEYNYAEGDPIGKLDPTGRVSVLDVVVTLAIHLLLSIILEYNIKVFRQPGGAVDVGLSEPVDLNLVKVLYHSVEITGSIQTTDQIFKDLQTLPTSIAVTEDTVNDVNTIVRFNMGYLFGIGQADFAVRIVKFDRTGHSFTAHTLKGHPVAGWRQWSVFDLPNGNRVVETFSVEHPVTTYDRWKFNIGGLWAMYKTWEGLLTRIVERSGGDPVSSGGMYDAISGEERTGLLPIYLQRVQ